MKVAAHEVLALAIRAEGEGQPALAEHLYAVAGRMGRGPCPIAFEADLGHPESFARGVMRARRPSIHPYGGLTR